MVFRICEKPIDTAGLAAALDDHGAGGAVIFEGRVRNENEGRAVSALEYQAYAPLCHKEGERILAEARERFGVLDAVCHHRVGRLDLGDCAVWIGVLAGHRGEAFAACRYVIDEIKVRLPIWKKEIYRDGDSGWIRCERCVEAGHAGP